MDDKKQPTTDINTNQDVPPAGDTSIPPAPPVADDVPPPPPPLSPEEVKTPAQPLPKTEEKVETPVSDKPIPTPPILPTNEPTPIPDPMGDKMMSDSGDTVTQGNSDTVAQEKSDTVTQGNSDAVAQEKSDAVTQKDKNTTPLIPSKEDATTPIAPPNKEEMPVEAKFPGQPLPVEAQQNLENKAKEMIDKDGGVKKRKVEVIGKPKGNVKKTLVGMLLFVLVGGGAFAGMRLMGNTTENRSQAGVTDPDWCPAKDSDECKVGSCQSNNLQFCTKDPYKGCNWTCSSDSNKETIRVNCCDGKWYTWNYDPSKYGTSKAKDLACSGHGGWKNCDGPVSQCTCESWASQYACGLNCKFPAGTAAAAQKKADSLCKPVIAMCNVSNGKVTYEVFGENHKCRGHVQQCDNPVAQPDCKEDPKACNESCVEGECDDGLVCDTTSNTCRNPSCSTSENCVCPEGDVVCNSLTCDQGGLELGNSYSFTCSASVTGSKKIETYEFRYQINDDAWIDLPLSSVDSNVSSKLFIENPGNYVIECRACEDRVNKEKCTPYQTPDSY